MLVFLCTQTIVPQIQVCEILSQMYNVNKKYAPETLNYQT